MVSVFFRFCWIPFVFAGTVQAASLDQAVQSALQKNETVAQSREQLRRSEEQISQARSAIFPNLSLNASYLIQPKPSDPIAAEFFPEQQRTANFTLTQPLFRGFREFAALRQRKNLYSAQEQARLGQLIKLYQEIAASFLDVLALEQDLRNLEGQKTIYAQRVKDLQARTRRGESSTTEALTAQSTAAALDAETQMVQSRLRTARENMSFLTGLPVDEALTDTDDMATFTLRPLSEYLARIDERPDVKALKENARAADEEVSIARGGHWPSADVVGNYYLVRPEGFMEDLKWDVTFKFSLPLFEGGLRQSQVREAASKRGESELELARIRRQTEAEIKSLHESLRIRADQLKALKLASDLSEKNYQVLLRDSRRGLTRSIDVQLGLTEYRVARRTFDQARYQARLDRIKLETAAAILPSALTKEM
ncbi:MAG: TolC family protein [Bdellovibrionaceae bacterium]|nr:TolC family protein [Pseudobdellovibrionaceae bacterium]